MSAYVVSYETMNRLLAGLSYTQYRHDTYPHGPRELLGRPFDANCEPEALTALGIKLLSLNVRAVQCRYEDLRSKTPSECVGFFNPGMEHTDFVYDPATVSPTPAQLYKTLQCFIYQCSEGAIIHDPLYKELEEWWNRIGHFIISNLPEYNSAVWG